MPRRGRAARRRALAVRVVELLVGDGPDDDRQLDRRAEHGRGRRDLGHVAEDAGPERPAREGGAVLAQRPLVARAAGEVRPRPGLEPLLGEPLVVGDGERLRHGLRLLGGAAEDLGCGLWKPAGRSWAAMLRAISSISPIQRHPLRRAERSAPARRSSSSGIESRHSSSSASSTPSARASSRTVSSRAALPFVQPAYAAFSADAAPG